MARNKFYPQTAPPFSRQWWFGTGRNLLWVAIIAILIWIYADMQFTTERQFTVRVQAVLKNPEKLIFKKNTEMKIKFTLKGSRGSLDRFESWLRKQNGPIEYDVSRHPTGKLMADAANVIYDTTDIHELGLTVKDASFTDDVVVELDNKVILTNIKVEFVHEGAYLKDEKTSISPAEISVAVAQTQSKDIGTTIQTELVDLSKVEPNKYFEDCPVKIRHFIGNISVEPIPNKVMISYEVDQLTSRKTFDNVNVRISFPPSWLLDNTWGVYELKGKDAMEWRQSIEVSGAKKDIERLRAEDMDVCLKLTDADKAPVDSWASRDVVVRFPPGFRVELVGKKPIVNFKMEKRETAPSAPTTP